MLADTINLLGHAFALGHEAVNQNGTDFQTDMAIEECAELVMVLQHKRRARATDAEVAEEIADVLIMMMVLLRVFGTKHINAALKMKLNRMRDRLE